MIADFARPPKPAGERVAPAPLSFGQQRMWLLSQLSGAAAVNLVMAVRLTGSLNVVALGQAFDDVIERHEVLRSVIVVSGGEAVQAPGARRTMPLHIVDVSALPAAAAVRCAQRLLRDQTSRPFDLAAGPVARVCVVALGRREHLVSVAMHHAVTDGWSTGLLAGEVSALYNAVRTGRPGARPSRPPVQYRDFARWQRSRPEQPLWAERARRLVSTAGGAPLWSGPRPAQRRRVAATWTCTFPPSLTQGLAHLRRAEGGSLFMLVLSGLMSVIHRLDARQEVAVGTLAAGRTRPEFERLLGYFGNVLVLHASFAPGITFRELWRQVREECVAAYAHQDLPYERLLAHAHGEHSAYLNPPVSVLCVVQQPPPPLALSGLDAQAIDVPHSAAQFDLTVEVRERSGGLHVAFQYDMDVLDEATVSLLGRYLRGVLTSAVADVDTACAELRLEDPPPRRLAAPVGAVTRPGAAVSADAGVGESTTLHELFERQTLLTPDAVALSHRGSVITFGCLNERANRLARHMLALGVRIDEPVAVCLERSLDSVCALLAVLKAGAAVLPLDPGYPPRWLVTLLSDSAVRFLVTTAALADLLDGTDRPAGLDGVAGLSAVECVVRLDADAAAISAHPPTNPRRRVSPDNLAYVLYTSGSTGAPRGVLGPHRGVVNRLRWMWREHPFMTGELACHRTRMSFVDCISEIFGPLLRGVAAEIVDDDVVAEPAVFATVLARLGVSRVLVVPALLRVLLDVVPDLGRRTAAMRLWVSSGEALPGELAASFHEALPGRVLLNLYGSTEIAADATAAVVRGARVSIGRPIDAVTAVVARDGTGLAAPALVAGELRVGGAALARGYLGRRGHTAAQFVPDPGAATPGARAFRTGDLVRQRPSGELDYVGRLDDQVQIRGARVEPIEVEGVLLTHPCVADAAVSAVADAAGSSSLIAHVVLRSPCPPALLRAFARDRLAPHAVPSVVIAVDSLPRTPSGKLDRRHLPEPRADATEDQLPRDATEAAVAEIFADLLPVRWRSVHDDFFALGGHSILAITALHRLSERCGVSLGLRDIIAEPSVAGLARRVAEGREVSAGVPVVAHPDQWYEPFPLTDVQQAYWIGRDPGLELGNVATHAYIEIDADAIEPTALATALNRLVQRHPALRTVIRVDGRQQVLREVERYLLRVIDLRRTGPDERKRELMRLRAELSHQVLAADEFPLFDIRLVRCEEGRDRLLASVDALIADAYSVGILMDELALLYHDQHAVLAPLEVTFRDCVQASEATRGLPAYQRSLSYWRSRLAQLPTGPELPLARHPSQIVRPRFRRWSSTLDAQTWRRLRQRGARCGLTPPALLLAAFAEVVTAWSARAHYTLTLTLFTRPDGHPHLRRIVGDFTSLTLLEVDHRGSSPFVERARALQARMWADLDHRGVSGVSVLREWTRLRGGRPGLLAPVVFTSNLGLDGLQGTGSRLGELTFALTQTPQLYLDHQVAETPGGLALTWDVVEELFAPGLIDDMFGAYLGLLGRLADEAYSWERPIGDLAPADQLTRRAVVNATRRPCHRARLDHLVVAAAAVNPYACAVVVGGAQLSYGRLTELAGHIGQRLHRLGVRRGDLVGVLAPKGWEQVVAVLAIHTAAAAYVPLDPSLPDRRMRLLREQTALRVVLTTAALRDRAAGLLGVTPLVIEAPTSQTSQTSPASPASPTSPTSPTSPAPIPGGRRVGGDGDLAYVIFTSGSTGVPKGVMIGHRGAANTVTDISRRFAVGPADRVLGISSLSFDLSVWDVFGTLAAGATIVLPDADHIRDPAAWADLVERTGVTIWNSVPALMSLVTEYAAARAPVSLRSLRLVLLSGDWIPLDLPDRIRALAPGAAVVSLGGATEASIWSVFFPITAVDPGWLSIPYGRPLVNQSLHVLDPAGRARPDGVAGELQIGGDGLAMGYWGQPGATAVSFVPAPRGGRRWYRTGDLARYRSDATVEFLGRADRQVKINGYRVEPGEVESALLRLPGIASAAVVAAGQARTDRHLAAFYVTEAGTPVSPATLRTQLAAVLPDYLVPHAFRELTTLPLTANGKVDHAALTQRGAPPPPSPSPLALAGAGRVPDAAATASTHLERSLAGIWALVLGVDRVGRDDSFFELGGTSLVAIRLLSRLEATYGVKIPLVRLYEAPSIAQLAVELSAAMTASATAAAPGGVVPDGVAPDGVAPGDEPAGAVAGRLVAAPHARHDPFPLTPIQEAYWLGRRRGLALGGVATHSYLELDVSGLDVDRLERAVQSLVDRHDALRTVVRPDGRAQVLAAPTAYRLRCTDLRPLAPAAAREHLDRRRARLSHQVLPAERWPLFTIEASIVDNERTRLHIGVDLLIADALSFQILQRELLAIYHDPAAPLAPLRCTFRDYVLAQEQGRDSGATEAARRYWSDRVGALPQPPPLPLHDGRAGLARPRFERLAGHVAAQEWARLKRHAGARNLTPSGLLCAAFADVLAMWSQCAHFTLNLTTFDRQPLHPDVEAIVGDFTSTTLLAVDASGATFAARAGQVQRRILEDLDHRAFGGVEVARLLRRDPDRRGRTVAPIVFTSMLLGETVAHSTPAWDAEVAYSVSQTPQVLLDHQVYEHEGALTYTWDSVIDAFPPGLVAAMFDAFGRLLGSLGTDGAYWQAATGWPG